MKKIFFFQVLLLWDQFDCHSENVYLSLSRSGQIVMFLKVGIHVRDDNSTVALEKTA